MNRNRVLLASSVAATLTYCMSSSAQEARTPTAEELETVIVTAQKYSEDVQKTPIAMNVYQPSELAAAGVSNLQTLSILAPSLNYAENGGQVYLTVRGVSSKDLTEMGDSAVLVTTDGFSVNRSYALGGLMFDIARIEVLKGPQGTLYGRNATGGAVNVVSQRPTENLEGGIALTYGNFETMNADAFVNVPLSDAVKFRAAVAYKAHDGYRDNAPLPDRGDEQDDKAARVQLAFDPTDRLSGRLAFTYLDQGGVGQAELRTPFVRDIGGFVVHEIPPLNQAPDTYTMYAPHALDLTDKRIQAELSYRFLPSDLTLTYLGGYDDLEWHRRRDTTTAAYITTGVGAHRQYQQNEFPETWNHELRLSSQGERMFWQIGSYYFKEESRLLSKMVDIPPGSFVPSDTVFLYFDFPSIETESVAGFGHVSFNVSDTVKLSAGARYTDDKKSRVGELVVVPANAHTNQGGEASSTKWTYHAGLDWTPSDSTLVYAKVDSGYKPGGFSGTSTGIVQYDPETLLAYEIGTKSRFLEDTVQFNTSWYYQDYRDKQVQQFVPTFSATLVTNAEKAEIYGVDAQLTALIEPLGRVDLEVDYMHARFEDFTASPSASLNPAEWPNCTASASPQQTCQLAGFRLPQSPDWTIAGGIEHTWEGVFGGALTARVQSRYATKQFIDFFNYGSTEQKAYSLSSAFLTYAAPGDKWSLQFYARNLEDEDVFSDALESTSGGANVYVYAWQPPRTYGVTFNMHFE
jgi:iron complex outermembrane receptor protein